MSVLSQKLHGILKRCPKVKCTLPRAECFDVNARTLMRFVSKVNQIEKLLN